MNSISHKYTFKKKERLTKKDDINNLFSEGSGFTIYPLKFIYCVKECNNTVPPIRILVTTPKKIHRRAVKRNLVKRRIKEAYRIIKPSIYPENIFEKTSIDLGVIYISKDIISYREIEKKILLGLKKLVVEISRREKF